MKYLFLSPKLYRFSGPALLIISLLLSSAAIPTKAQQSRALRVTSANIERGKQGTVTVEIDAQGDENTLGFSLDFDWRRLSYVSAVMGSGVPAGSTLLINANQKDVGRLGFAISRAFGASLTAGTQQLLVVTFKASEDDSASTSVDFGDQPIPREYVRADASTIPVGAVALVPGTVTIFSPAVSASAASYSTTALAVQSIAAVFGTNLASGTATAATIPLPRNLLGTTIGVKDSAGVEREAGQFFVSPGQANYEIPSGTATGPATVTVTSANTKMSIGTIEVAAIAPGFFTADSSGRGIAAAIALRVRGSQQFVEQISQYNAGTNSFDPIPIDLGPEGDQVFLIMFGTGFRFRSGENGVSVKVGGRTLQSLFSGAVQGFIGLDQLNLSPLPRELAGAGVVNVEITIDGKAANTTTLSIK
jgi:uncharacterized protein (TIGR03437 family)